MIDDKFSKLLKHYKERQENRESERQGRTIKFAWDEIARRCNISRQKLAAWQQGDWTPESRRTDRRKKAFEEVGGIADFFELTDEERAEFFQAAGFDALDEDPTEEPKTLYYLKIGGRFTKKQKQKLVKLIKPIYSFFQAIQTFKFEIDGEVTDEELEKINT